MYITFHECEKRVQDFSWNIWKEETI